nr:uncharacterized protein LOC109190276 [Ipomoea batatas]
MEAMGISGEDELSEMVRDFLESDSTFISAAGNNSYNENSCDDEPHQVEIVEDHQLSLQEILENATEAETEILGKIMSYWREEAAGMKMEPKELRKWMVSRLRMDGYDASLCKTFRVKTSARSSSALKFSGDYEYIDVMMKSSESEREQLRVIVDTDFRSQFEVARPTEAYKELSSFLPCIFILQWNPSSLPLSEPRNAISRENHEASVTSPNPSSVKQLQKWPTPPLPNSSGSSRKHRFPKENVPPPDPYTSPSAATKHKSSLSPRPPNSKHKSPTGSETAVSGSSGSGVKGGVNVVMGNASDIGEALLASPQCSTDVGKKLMVGSAAIVKKVSLELGGNEMHLA